jgi:hypothetical protein
LTALLLDKGMCSWARRLITTNPSVRLLIWIAWPCLWPQVKADSLALNTIARNLRATRFANGALALTNTRLSFALSPEGLPLSWGHYVQMEAHQLIEEFMLLANMSVARLIAEAFPGRAMLRWVGERCLALIGSEGVGDAVVRGGGGGMGRGDAGRGLMKQAAVLSVGEGFEACPTIL